MFRATLIGFRIGDQLTYDQSATWETSGTLPGLKRWLVLGAGGAGKTKFALELGRILQLPVIHLDRHYWQPGWVASSNDAWDQKVIELAAADQWIMDGNYSRTLEPRLRRAQAVVLVDPPTIQCLWGVIRRMWFSGHRPRPDLAAGCRERLMPDPQFLYYVASYKRRSRPKVFRRIGEARHVRFHHLRGRSETRAFLRGLRMSSMRSEA